MKVCDVVNIIDSAAPYNIACDWDNSGFLVGYGEADVKRVLVALDLTDSVLSEAEKAGCNLIVTHHPFIFKGLSRITDESFEGRMVLKLIEKGINLVCAHTNLDMAKGGINDVLCEALELCNITHLGFAAKDDSGDVIGEFRMGETDCDLDDFVKRVKSTLGCAAVRYSNSDNVRLKKVAVCSGSGCDFLGEAVKAGADAYVTADAKYHNFQTAENSGIVLIDAGHFETENIICDKLSKLLGDNGLDVIRSKSHKGFYKTL